MIWDVIEIFFPYLVNFADFNNNNNNNNRVIWMKIKEIKKSNPERNFSKFVTADGLFQEDKYTAYAIAKKFGLPSKNSRRTIESSIF